MTIPKLKYIPVLLAAAVGSGLQAQQAMSDGLWDLNFKVRCGLYGGDLNKAHYDNNIIGFGAQFKRTLFGDRRAVSAEITWEHVTGRHHDLIDYSRHVGVLNPDTDEPETRFDLGILNLSPAFSFDDRKEGGKGFSLLFAYHAPFPYIPGIPSDVSDNLEWFAGIRLDNYSVRSEFKWTMYNMDGVVPPVPGGQAPVPGRDHLYVGGWGAFHEQSSAFAPGFFAGIRYALNENIGFELSTRYFGMKHYEFTNGAYKNQLEGTMKESNTYGYSIEFAFSCKL
jgi:opacity protein-like surface antigen